MLASVRWNVGNVCDVIHTHTEVMAPIDRLGDELGGPHRNTGYHRRRRKWFKKLMIPASGIHHESITGHLFYLNFSLL
jgi:hypothetical protein